MKIYQRNIVPHSGFSDPRGLFIARDTKDVGVVLLDCDETAAGELMLMAPTQLSLHFGRMPKGN